MLEEREMIIMNSVLETLNDHRSIRQYTNEPVSEEQLTAIIDAVQAAPSSINGQQVTVITVQNPETKKKVADLTGGQAWIEQAPVFLLFCADFNRAKIATELTGTDLKVTDGAEAVLVGATDVGIAVGTATAAAESMGLGTVPIGAVRGRTDEMIELFDIPEYVFPVCGLVVGHPADRSAKKPRFPQEAVRHAEKYNNNLKGFVQQYDEQISAYMTNRTNGKETRTWSETISSLYTRVYYPHIKEMLNKQGFSLKE